MTDAGTIINEASDSKARTPRSQKLPTCSPNDLRTLLEALTSFGGPISKARLAKQTGSTVASSGFKSKLGAAGYYGFMTQKAGNLEMTDRGMTFLSDDSVASQKAAQEAVMSTGFAAVIQRQTTRPANAATIAGLLVDTAAVPEKRADATAAELIDVCTETGLIDDGRFDPEPIESAMGAVSEITVTPAPARAQRSTPATRPKPATNGSKGQGSTGKPKSEVEDEPSHPFAPISVVIEIDAAKLSASEIKDIVRELSRPTAN